MGEVFAAASNEEVEAELERVKKAKHKEVRSRVQRAPPLTSTHRWSMRRRCLTVRIARMSDTAPIPAPVHIVQLRAAQKEVVEIEAEMAQLKKDLYAKFGKSINLETTNDDE